MVAGEGSRDVFLNGLTYEYEVDEVQGALLKRPSDRGVQQGSIRGSVVVDVASAHINPFDIEETEVSATRLVSRIRASVSYLCRATD
jgi:hypothetical protein